MDRPYLAPFTYNPSAIVKKTTEVEVIKPTINSLIKKLKDAGLNYQDVVLPIHRFRGKSSKEDLDNVSASNRIISEVNQKILRLLATDNPNVGELESLVTQIVKEFGDNSTLELSEIILTIRNYVNACNKLVSEINIPKLSQVNLPEIQDNAIYTDPNTGLKIPVRLTPQLECFLVLFPDNSTMELPLDIAYKKLVILIDANKRQIEEMKEYSLEANIASRMMMEFLNAIEIGRLPFPIIKSPEQLAGALNSMMAEFEITHRKAVLDYLEKRGVSTERICVGDYIIFRNIMLNKLAVRFIALKKVYKNTKDDLEILHLFDNYFRSFIHFFYNNFTLVSKDDLMISKIEA